MNCAECCYWSSDAGENHEYCHWQPVRGDDMAPCEEYKEDED